MDVLHIKQVLNGENCMKRLLAGVLSVLIGISAFAGCSSTGGTANTQPVNSNADKSTPADSKAANTSIPTDKVTLRFEWWGGDDRHEATLKAIKWLK